jgi:hypothetical protein
MKDNVEYAYTFQSYSNIHVLKTQLPAPNEIWREMKNSTLIKQIANNQRAYKQQNYNI